MMARFGVFAADLAYFQTTSLSTGVNLDAIAVYVLLPIFTLQYGRKHKIAGILLGFLADSAWNRDEISLPLTRDNLIISLRFAPQVYWCENDAGID